MERLVFAVVALAAVVAVAEDVRRPSVKVDFAREKGIVKPVNGVGQGPLVGWIGTDMFAFLKEAGIPYARLHDVGGLFGGGGRFVDIPNVFPDFDADEDDPKNYEFRFTDLYLKALIDNGVEPFYRLGVTIENVAGAVGPFRVRPPKDFAKWARICEHVVRHYNEGWANGYRWNIRYWEVWNEPEDVNGDRKVMWWGTFRQYCELYEATAKLLKEKHPDIKVGGYGGCGFYSVYGDMGNPALHERYEYFTKCFDEFLAFVRERNCPLDFYSYHSYDRAENFRHHMPYVRRKLDEAGFTKTETSVNEWLATGCPPGEAPRAACIARMLAIMQDGPVDTAMLYDGRCQNSSYSPLFKSLDPYETAGNPHYEHDSGIPRKPYYAMLYFNELRKLGTAVAVETDDGNLGVVAATDGKGNGAVMVANTSDATVFPKWDFGGWRTGVVRYTDKERTDGLSVRTTALPPHCVALIRLCRDRASARITGEDGVQNVAK